MPTPEEIKAIQDENIALKQQVNDLGIEKNKLVSDLAVKVAALEDLKKNAEERSGQFKKFKEMNEAEKELLSEKEKELLQRQDALEEARLKDMEDRKVYDKKIKDATINNLATRIAKGDKDLAEQIKINLSKLSPELLNKATTEEELTPIVQDAFNMTGSHVNNESLRQAINSDGLPAKVDGEKDFADTQEGKTMGSMLNLSFTKENNKQ